MKTADYLDQLLRKYSGTFDISQPYVIRGKEYPAYGYFFSHIEKYILVREANMWSTDSYEHILFIETREVDQALIEEAYSIIKEYMEPVLVRKGAELPPAGHMYSYLTIGLIAEQPLTPQMRKAIRNMKKGIALIYVVSHRLISYAPRWLTNKSVPITPDVKQRSFIKTTFGMSKRANPDSAGSWKNSRRNVQEGHDAYRIEQSISYKAGRVFCKYEFVPDKSLKSGLLIGQDIQGFTDAVPQQENTLNRRDSCELSSTNSFGYRYLCRSISYIRQILSQGMGN